jgi:hypothetical protein
MSTPAAVFSAVFVPRSLVPFGEHHSGDTTPATDDRNF